MSFGTQAEVSRCRLTKKVIKNIVPEIPINAGYIITIAIK